MHEAEKRNLQENYQSERVQSARSASAGTTRPVSRQDLVFKMDRETSNTKPMTSEKPKKNFRIGKALPNWGRNLPQNVSKIIVMIVPPQVFALYNYKANNINVIVVSIH